MIIFLTWCVWYTHLIDSMCIYSVKIWKLISLDCHLLTYMYKSDGKNATLLFLLYALPPLSFLLPPLIIIISLFSIRMIFHIIIYLWHYNATVKTYISSIHSKKVINQTCQGCKSVSSIGGMISIFWWFFWYWGGWF